MVIIIRPEAMRPAPALIAHQRSLYCAMPTSKPYEHRCDCGRLLARHADHDALLRCPRCKREVAIDLAAGPEQRCGCGRLLARRSAAGAMVIRCPRCKREHPYAATGWHTCCAPAASSVG